MQNERKQHENCDFVGERLWINQPKKKENEKHCGGQAGGEIYVLNFNWIYILH